MSIRLANITLDCASPDTVAAFWSGALSGTLETHIPNAFVAMKTADNGSWFFLRVPEPTCCQDATMRFSPHGPTRRPLLPALAAP